MYNKFHRQYLSVRIFHVFLTVVILLSAFPVSSSAAVGDVAENNIPIIVSLGDSYSSGEGIEPFYGQDKSFVKKVKEEDWLAHRSKKSWGGMLSLKSVDGTMSNHRNKNWFFAAVSGAVTENISQEKQYKAYNKTAGRVVVTDSTYLPLQIDVFKEIENNEVDYVTLTLGGNDAGFTDIVVTAAMNDIPFLNPGSLADKINGALGYFYEKDGIRDKLEQVYKEIETAAGKQAKIIVAGYPKLMDPDGSGFLFSAEDVKIINTAVSTFNKAIKNLVESCNSSGMNIHFVSVEEIFDGHGAYSKDPYINEVKTPQSEDLVDFLSVVKNKNGEKDNPCISSAYSVHPNEKGACAYAACVQAKINELENTQAESINYSDETTYSTDLKVSVLNYNLEHCSDYKIIVEGTKNVALWGLISDEYYEEITVSTAGVQKLSLPKGKYTVTVTDGSSSYSKKIKTRPHNDNSDLKFYTVFDYEIISEETNIQGQFDNSNLLDGAVMYNNHWYKAISDSTINDWNSAQQYCENLNGYLATITSKEENDFVYNYLKNDCGYESAYIGFSDQLTEGDWQWVTGEKVSYTNWYTYEPNGQNTSEDFGMFYYKYQDGTWNDGDFGYLTENGGTVFICEWGEYTPESAEKEMTSQPKRETSDERDIVLVLDVSGSMSGTPLEETKKAATKFVNTILKEDASIGIVTYDDTAAMMSDFSIDETYLTGIASEIRGGGGTNIESGLQLADGMLSTSNAEKKIIVLMSDGAPNEGKVGDELVEYAGSIKEKGTYIYTLGFFSSMGSGKHSAQTLMQNIASDGCHYEVADADDLVFFFGDIADQINGQKFIYVRIACPVDVTVTYLGESLSSSEKDFNDRTSFGALSLEDIEDSDDKIKTLRLKEGKDYSIKIKGTGRGKMDYTIGYMDDSGEYSDMRNFRNIDITRSTVIDTSTKYSDKTILNVDEDGDGKYDLKFRAGANEYGELVDYTYIVYIVSGIVGAVAILAVILVIRKKSKNRKAAQ